MYVTMERKPENGVEIHNDAYGRAGIMMHIRIVKFSRHETEQEYYGDNLPRGTQVLK